MKPFNPELGLFRATLVNNAAGRSALVIVAHHSIVDRRSITIIWERISYHYNGLFGGRKITPVSANLHYDWFSCWERKEDSTLDPVFLSFWRRYLRGQVKTIELPTDRPRAKIHVYRVGVVDVKFPVNVARRVLSSPKDLGTDVGTILMACFKIRKTGMSGKAPGRQR